MKVYFTCFRLCCWNKLIPADFTILTQSATLQLQGSQMVKTQNSKYSYYSEETLRASRGHYVMLFIGHYLLSRNSNVASLSFKKYTFYSFYCTFYLLYLYAVKCGEGAVYDLYCSQPQRSRCFGLLFWGSCLVVYVYRLVMSYSSVWVECLSQSFESSAKKPNKTPVKQNGPAGKPSGSAVKPQMKVGKAVISSSALFTCG